MFSSGGLKELTIWGGIMSLERKFGILGISLAALLSCGVEGSSAKGCKDDNDCKGDRYCDEETGQCTDNEQREEGQPILNEEFNSQTLDYHWGTAGCSQAECPDWNNNCKGGCPAIEGEHYTIEKGILTVLKDSDITYGAAIIPAEGMNLEYKVRDSKAAGAFAGLVLGQQHFIGCYADTSNSVGCDTTKDSKIDAEGKNFPALPTEWNIIKIEADAKQVKFIVNDLSPISEDISSIEGFSSSEWHLYLGEGEYDYIKVWKE